MYYNKELRCDFCGAKVEEIGCGDSCHYLLVKGTIVFGFNSRQSEVSLPIGITEINNNAFKNNKNITKVNFPFTVKKIGKYAFANCDNLQEINLGNVHTIEEGAFWGCKSLTKINLETVKSIKNSAFEFSGVQEIEAYDINKVGLFAFKATPILYSRFNISQDESEIYFGMYPQSRVEDEKLISSLLRSIKHLPINDSCQSLHYGWTPYNYHSSDWEYKENDRFMWYIDIKRGDDLYRGVYFTDYRSEYQNHQKENGYIRDVMQSKESIYWFKWEPIKWHIVKKEDNIYSLICASAIDCQPYLVKYRTELRKVTRHEAPANTYENNYEYSSIRKWLNSSFYNTAFSNEDKEFIVYTLVDNSFPKSHCAAKKYFCADTLDKVYLPSQEEIWLKFLYPNNLPFVNTDYANMQGACNNTFNHSSYTGRCLTRTPFENDDEVVCFDYYREFLFSVRADELACGIVPCLRININADKVEEKIDLPVYKRIAESGAMDTEGKFIYFGHYPQGEVDDEYTLQELSRLSNSSFFEINHRKGWKRFTDEEYYNSNMWYTDVDFNGCRYRGILLREKIDYANKYGYVSDKMFHSIGIGHYFDRVYWFKWASIKWRILEEVEGYAKLICDSIIDAQPFCVLDDKYGKFIYGKRSGITPASHYPSSNDYLYSYIRKWLNESFFNTAFSLQEQEQISIINRENNGEYFKDRISLLSLNEALFNKYGFNIIYDKVDELRKRKCSDYAEVQGANHGWILRTANDESNDYIWGVSSDGDLHDQEQVTFMFSGIVPTLVLKL